MCPIFPGFTAPSFPDSQKEKERELSCLSQLLDNYFIILYIYIYMYIQYIHIISIYM
jgi:hypothetical protein